MKWIHRPLESEGMKAGINIYGVGKAHCKDCESEARRKWRSYGFLYFALAFYIPKRIDLMLFHISYFRGDLLPRLSFY